MSAGHMAKLPTVKHQDVWRLSPIFECPTTTWIEISPGVKILINRPISGNPVQISVKTLTCTCQEK